MRLSFHLEGAQLVNTVEGGTLSYQQQLPYDRPRVARLSRDVVEVLARSTRGQTIAESNLRRLRETGEQLLQALVHPRILNRLPGRPEPLLLQLDRHLVPIPWELLHDADGFWCDRFDLGRAVATPQTAPMRPASERFVSARSLRMLVICADPRGDLPRVHEEGEALLARFDASGALEVDLLADPTLEQVRREMKRYDLVHYAGHADFVAERPAESGWSLADGKLTAREVASLGTGSTMPLLIFANACHSGQSGPWEGDPAQVHGLANAFLLAGVPLYVGTEWEVVDERSVDLAVPFYEALARGAGAGLALRVARRAVQRQHGVASLGWAGYVLYGAPRTRLVDEAIFDRGGEMPTPAQLRQSAKVPRKRPLPTGPQQPTRRRTRWLLMGAPAVAALTVAVVALVIALGGVNREAKAPRDGGNVAPQLEPAPAGQARPLVALLLSEGESARRLRRCLSARLAASGRFRLISAQRAAQHQPRGPLSSQLATRIGRALGAEIVVFARPLQADAGGGPRLAVADVLTGEVPIERATTGGRCGPLVREMIRVLHGEGRVVSVEAGRVVVDLGWRSRVAPGTVLRLLRGGRPAGSLTVDEVQMDRSTCRGQARVGDVVRAVR